MLIHRNMVEFREEYERSLKLTSTRVLLLHLSVTLLPAPAKGLRREF